MPDTLRLKLSRLESVPNDFIDAVVKNQNGIFNDVIADLNKLTIDSSGNIVMSNENLGLIKTLGRDFEDAIIRSGYGKSVTGFVKEFEVQKDLNNKYFESTIEGFEPKSNLDALYKVKQEQAVSLLAETAVSENVTAFEGALQNAIANSGSFTDLVKNLQVQIQGNSQIDGGLSRYARQNARDIYSISERSYTSAVADEFGIEFYTYAGPTQDTTRPFCDERVNKVWHMKEIQSWASESWAGKAQGTNKDTIFSLLGGYQCNHSLIPKGIKDVPINVIERNLASGNIKMEDLPESIQNRLK